MSYRFFKLADGNVIKELGIVNDYSVVISCISENSSPFLLQQSQIKFAEKIEDTFTKVFIPDQLENWMVEKAEARFELIKQLVAPNIILNKTERVRVIKEICASTGVSRQTVTSYFWKYCVTGGIAGLVPVLRGSHSEKPLTADQKNIRWALNQVYYTTDRNGLQYAYQQMLLRKYMKEGNVLASHYPSFWRFRYYYRTHKSEINSIISRNGLSYYQRNARPIPGSVREYAPKIGVFMTDATQADIFLVNRLTRKPMARPNIFIMIDAYSNLITGVHIGYEAGTDALRLLVLNTISDKVEYCKRHGVIIEAKDWPSMHMPEKIITDRGKEFTSGIVQNLCDSYGVVVEHLPAFRPELKGPVEKIFDLIQSAYKPIMSKNGVVQSDFAERGAPDYQLAATLDIEEFTRVVLKTIIFLNSQKVLSSYERTPEMIEDDVPPIPARIWSWCEKRGDELSLLNYEAVFFSLLPRSAGKITRRGLIVGGIRYYSDAFKERFVVAGRNGAQPVSVAYIPQNVDRVWLIEKGKYFEFKSAQDRFNGLSMAEVENYRAGEADAQKGLAENETLRKLELQREIDDIAQASVRELAVDSTTKRLRDVRESKEKASETMSCIDILVKHQNGEL